MIFEVVSYNHYRHITGHNDPYGYLITSYMLDDPYSRNDQLLVMVKTYKTDTSLITITDHHFTFLWSSTNTPRLTDQAGKAAARAVAQQRSKAAKARSKICEEVLILMNHDI